MISIILIQPLKIRAFELKCTKKVKHENKNDRCSEVSSKTNYNPKTFCRTRAFICKELNPKQARSVSYPPIRQSLVSLNCIFYGVTSQLKPTFQQIAETAPEGWIVISPVDSATSPSKF